jgi:hypothetical protein
VLHQLQVLWSSEKFPTTATGKRKMTGSTLFSPRHLLLPLSRTTGVVTGAHTPPQRGGRAAASDEAVPARWRRGRVRPHGEGAPTRPQTTAAGAPHHAATRSSSVAVLPQPRERGRPQWRATQRRRKTTDAPLEEGGEGLAAMGA